MYRIYINNNIYIYTPRAVHIYGAHGYEKASLSFESPLARELMGAEIRSLESSFYRESTDIGESCID